ncbi:hypothetical protein G6F65_014059 [Rhizopus arrhizus]|nr:hypothetical protein G6F65_014059 [Rhizopus arrhizus]
MQKAYRIPDNDCACSPVGKAPEKTRPIGRYNVRSFITGPADGARVTKGQRVPVRGIAFDGGRGIRDVQFSADGGKTWRAASLGEDLGRYSFREWHADFTPEQAGVYVLKVRATNTAGETQPLDPLWNPSGYMRNVVETVRVNAALAIVLAAMSACASAAALDIQLPPETATLHPGTGAGAQSAALCLMCHSGEYLSSPPPMALGLGGGDVEKLGGTYGAPIPAEQVPLIVEYLNQAYPPPPPAGWKQKKTPGAFERSGVVCHCRRNAKQRQAICGAKEGTRTPTPVTASGPKPGASTNFATFAKGQARYCSLLVKILRHDSAPRCFTPLPVRKTAGVAGFRQHAAGRPDAHQSVDRRAQARRAGTYRAGDPRPHGRPVRVPVHQGRPGAAPGDFGLAGPPLQHPRPGCRHAGAAGAGFARSAVRLYADGDRPVGGFGGHLPQPVLSDLRRRHAAGGRHALLRQRRYVAQFFQRLEPRARRGLEKDAARVRVLARQPGRQRHGAGRMGDALQAVRPLRLCHRV